MWREHMNFQTAKNMATRMLNRACIKLVILEHWRNLIAQWNKNIKYEAEIAEWVQTTERVMEDANKKQVRTELSKKCAMRLLKRYMQWQKLESYLLSVNSWIQKLQADRMLLFGARALMRWWATQQLLSYKGLLFCWKQNMADVQQDVLTAMVKNDINSDAACVLLFHQMVALAHCRTCYIAKGCLIQVRHKNQNRKQSVIRMARLGARYLSRSVFDMVSAMKTNYQLHGMHAELSEVLEEQAEKISQQQTTIEELKSWLKISRDGKLDVAAEKAKKELETANLKKELWRLKQTVESLKPWQAIARKLQNERLLEIGERGCVETGRKPRPAARVKLLRGVATTGLYV